ncbi:hypothetical protein F4777DRAFT_101741 [Nemania sp. FL0916]|nr:hypothetical protein F4777DRAFT_101741 [Nemania sp. FL0916]
MTGHFKRLPTAPSLGDSADIVTLDFDSLSPACRGNSGGKFVVHALPLAHHSRYFRNKLNVLHARNEPYAITVPANFKPKVVQIFVDWVYIQSTMSGILPSNNDVSTSYMPPVSRITSVECWVFGDYIEAPRFQNDIVKLILNQQSPSPPWVGSLGSEHWASIPQESPLESLLLDSLCRYLLGSDRDKINEQLGKLPSHIAKNVAPLLLHSLVGHNKGGHTSLMKDENGFTWKIGDFDKYEVACDEDDDDREGAQDDDDDLPARVNPRVYQAPDNLF